jgi:hypothetical protein
MYYGPLALLLHGYSFSLESDVVQFNQEFRKKAVEYV